LKFEGFRGLVLKDRQRVRLLSRNGKDLSKRFARIAAAVQALPCRSTILDGEIVCLDSDGKPCFEGVSYLCDRNVT
jgi:bifunctional non-homologous end joining protein LigD